ncbi:MAG: Ig-like domain-containing protein [Clostridia bacterium]|nr:Ig-like domain-containing protein [Clostridia bacterium]
MKNMRRLSIICLLLITAVVIASCSGSASELKLGADKTTAAPGETVTLSATIDGKSASDVTYSISEGEGFATIAGDKLTVNTNATAGAKIKAVAKTSSLTSNTVEITVVVPMESITASANGVTNIMPGNSTILSKTAAPTGATGDIVWVFEEGANIAAISGDVLVINSNAAVGSTVKVYAKCGDIKSNTLVFTVGVPATAIEISAIGSTDVVKGNSVTMTETITPANASVLAVTYTIVEGSDYATISGKTLLVKSDAPTGATVKVQATVGTVTSNVLTFTVAPTQAEINSTRYIISFEQDKITLDKNGSFTPSLEVQVYNANFEAVTGLEIDYVIVSGSDFIAINPNGYTCALQALGHGSAKIKATIRGTEVSDEANISVIVPPEFISLPDVFATRPGFVYSFSKVDPFTSAAEQLPFVATANGTDVCEDVKYTFTHKNGVTGDAVATYADGKITFNMTGEITVTVTSVSGSAHETSTSYRFNINEGYNVHTFAEMRNLADNSAYTGSLPINIVVLEKVGTYGYALVPEVALKPAAEQTFEEIIVINNRILFINKGAIINGNNHNVDTSGVRVVTADELNAYHSQGGDWEIHNSIIGIYPWSETDKGTYTYRVSISDLNVIGNCPINLDLNRSDPKGVYKIGILVGNYDQADAINANYYLDVKNVTVSATDVGMRFLHIIDGNVTNATVNNCFSNGIEIAGSIMTLEDMVYGACGATGIELVPQDSNKAGINRNTNQQITYAGTVTVQFYNNGSTEYFENKVLAGLTIPQIIQASFENSALTNEQIAHLNKGEGYVFVTFILHDLGKTENKSELIYPGFQNGGVINARDLPKDGTFDTTHEYIELDVAAFGINAGKAYFYNVQYQGD